MRKRGTVGEGINQKTPAGAAEAWHGTAGGYTNHSCRCDDCKAAWTEQCKQARIRRAATPKDPDDPRHGTYVFYQNHGCRCEYCTAAHTIYMRTIPSKRKKAA